jgi:hypothetical protein
MPTFIETVRYWQKQSGLGPQATALIGFSQGAIMSLESIKAVSPQLLQPLLRGNRPRQIDHPILAAVDQMHGGLRSSRSIGCVIPYRSTILMKR